MMTFLFVAVRVLESAINRLLIVIGLSVMITTPLLADTECVIVLHGLARTSKAMEKLARSLEASGYQVVNIDYPSRKKPIEELAPLAVNNGLDACRLHSLGKIHFVAHSMGGILVRYYLENKAIPELGHVVMLAPPNQGSEVVDKLAKIPGFKWFNGPAGLQLGTDQHSVPLKLGPVNYSLGVIAGTKTFNPLLSQFLPNPDDGKVSLARTKVAGMTDFLSVAVSHPFIMRDSEVIDQVHIYLNSGSFKHE